MTTPLTQEFGDARVNVEDMVAEQRWVLCVSIVLSQDPVEQPFALGLVISAVGQTSADLHHQLIREELQAIHSG